MNISDLPFIALDIGIAVLAASGILCPFLLWRECRRGNNIFGMLVRAKGRAEHLSRVTEVMKAEYDALADQLRKLDMLAQRLTVEPQGDIPDAELIRRAIATFRRPRSHRTVGIPRWGRVSATFALDRIYSYQLCKRFGFNPGDTVLRR